MSKNIKKNLEAFTLIELMIVVAIVGVMTAVVVISLTSGRAKKELQLNAREFAGVVRQAQNYALSGRQLVPGTVPCGYRVSWSGAGYNLVYMYKDAALACVLTSTTSYTIRNGITFSSANSFYFIPPFGNIFDNLGAPMTTGSVQADLVKLANHYYVCTYADGKVLETTAASCP